jgi:hypothetical protein
MLLRRGKMLVAEASQFYRDELTKLAANVEFVCVVDPPEPPDSFRK